LNGGLNGFVDKQENNIKIIKNLKWWTWCPLVINKILKGDIN